MPILRRCSPLALLVGLTTAHAQFNPGPNPIAGTVTAAQTISGGTGTVNGTLSVTGNNVAITVKGSSSIVNNGTIQQTSVLTGNNAGNSRAIRDNTGSLNLTITNGSAANSSALIQTAGADDIQMNKAGSTVTLYNYGTINSQNLSGGGNQAVDFNALTAVGTNTIYNYATGKLTANEADAVRPGVNGYVFNDGLIMSATTTGSSSDGIDAQTNSGISVSNAFSAASGTIEGGRHGITGGDTTGGVFTMNVTNNAGGTIQGDNGSGINIDGINANELVTVVNHGTITGNGVTGDGDGVDVDGLVNLTNTGTIRSINATGTGGSIEKSEGVTVGGGTLVNSGTIEGDVAAGNATAIGRGMTLAGVDKDANGNPIPVQGIYANTTVTNTGLVKGQTDSGIAVEGAVSGFTVTVNNNAGGTIEGGGATAAALQTGADNDTVNEAGTITADSSGKAIDLGAGNDTLNITGGVAAVHGDISGGTGANLLTIDPGAGHTFSYSGTISNFSTAQLKSGIVRIDGTFDPAAIDIFAGVTLEGTGTLDGNVVNDGTLVLGDSFTSPGEWTENGDYTQNSDGMLFEGIGSSGYGTLDVLGSVSLSGALDIGVLNGLTFGHGTTFTILNYTGNESGQFSSIIGDDAGDWTVVYGANDVQLVYSAGEPCAWVDGLFLLALAAAAPLCRPSRQPASI